MEQPIQGLMKTTMENIKEMIDVNTVIGDPVETSDGTVIIPISKVGFAFISGGGSLKILHRRQRRRSICPSGRLPIHKSRAAQDGPGKFQYCCR